MAAAAAAPLLLPLVLSMFAASDAAWCVCRSELGNGALQKALDYACGAGADCNPILQNGACYQPNTVAAHCSYAANSYYQRKGQTQGACDFAGSATLTNTDPSSSGCTYPPNPSAAGTSSTPSTSTGTPSTMTPTTGTPSTMTPTTGTPSTMTPTTGTPSTMTPISGIPNTLSPPATMAGGTTGGVLGGIGPSGTSTGGMDGSDGGHLPSPVISLFLVAMLLSILHVL